MRKKQFSFVPIIIRKGILQEFMCAETILRVLNDILKDFILSSLLLIFSDKLGYFQTFISICSNLCG